MGRTKSSAAVKTPPPAATPVVRKRKKGPNDDCADILSSRKATRTRCALTTLAVPMLCLTQPILLQGPPRRLCGAAAERRRGSGAGCGQGTGARRAWRVAAVRVRSRAGRAVCLVAQGVEETGGQHRRAGVAGVRFDTATGTAARHHASACCLYWRVSARSAAQKKGRPPRRRRAVRQSRPVGHV
eukprot:386144-Prymnesium_polylepis.1